jgi:hypothetical protein
MGRGIEESWEKVVSRARLERGAECFGVEKEACDP